MFSSLNNPNIFFVWKENMGDLSLNSTIMSCVIKRSVCNLQIMSSENLPYDLANKRLD